MATDVPESELLSRATLPSLEESVRAQAAGAPYDHRVGSAVLMQYQLFPECAKDSITVAILAKALSVLPGAEFAQCVCMVPASTAARTPVGALVELESLLQTANFVGFWAARRGGPAREAVGAIAGFDDAIRKFIMLAFEITYQRVPIEALVKALDVPVASIKDVATGRWEVAGDVVIMPLNAENQHQPKVFTETIKYSDVARVLLRR